MNIGPSFTLRMWTSLLLGFFSAFFLISSVFKFSYHWSHYGKAELGIAMLAAVSFIVLLVCVVTLIYSVIGSWRNIDRMKNEELKGWEEEMQLRRKRNREAREKEFAKKSEEDQ